MATPNNDKDSFADIVVRPYPWNVGIFDQVRHKQEELNRWAREYVAREYVAQDPSLLIIAARRKRG